MIVIDQQLNSNSLSGKAYGDAFLSSFYVKSDNNHEHLKKHVLSHDPISYPKVFLLNGLAGVGKTTLARQLAHDKEILSNHNTYYLTEKTLKIDMKQILSHLKEILDNNTSIGTIVILDDVENATMITPIWNLLTKNTTNVLNNHILIVASQHTNLLEKTFPNIPYIKFECKPLNFSDSVTLFQLD